MIVLVLTAVPAGLRGDLTRWLLEIAPGVFTGKVSRRVRDKLWDRVTRGLKDGSAVLVITAHDREQCYEILTAGKDRWIPADFDGLTLIRKPAPGPGLPDDPEAEAPDAGSVASAAVGGLTRQWAARRDGMILFTVTGPDAERLTREAGDTVAYRDLEGPTPERPHSDWGPWIDAS